MMQQVTITTQEELKETINDVLKDNAKNLNAKFEQLVEIGKKKTNYITRKQVAKMLSISLPTLHKYVKEGKLISYRIGGRVLFIEDEVIQSLTKREF